MVSLGFLGKHELKIDGKSRLMVPSRIKKVLKEQYSEDGMQVMVSPSLDKNLTVQPLSEFAIFMERYDQYDELDEDARKLKNILIGMAMQEKMDGSGRIRLAASLREAAGIGDEVTIVGGPRSFEIWDRAKWNQSQASALQDLPRLAEKVRRNQQAQTSG